MPIDATIAHNTPPGRTYGAPMAHPWRTHGARTAHFLIRRATRAEYVAWRSTLVEIIVPGFEKEVYAESA